MSSSLIGHEQGKGIVREYNTKFLTSMFLKCCHHLHLLAKSKNGIVDQGVDEDCNLDIFG
jgi:hypothetical protein